ncbi:hypothetical protein Psi01_36110 [Planobispora siamensis]|uniref:Uncharacterized protein n=1 Tax=Planobispora siamensis TaxID=936338 RepID=A0A8J3SE49_9ACTN|nr:hypothetical protein Psi01_36110 [Planobispora siamensis]
MNERPVLVPQAHPMPPGVLSVEETRLPHTCGPGFMGRESLFFRELDPACRERPVRAPGSASLPELISQYAAGLISGPVPSRTLGRWAVDGTWSSSLYRV